MKSLILQTATRFLLPLMMLFSILLLVTGHHKPGGGFIAGLMASAAVALAALAYDPATALRIVPIHPRHLLGVGLLVAAASGVWALPDGKPFLTHVWETVKLPGGGEVELGTALLFDVGVYLTVIGAVLTVLLSLSEEGGVP